ncbi:hypothetical protein ABZV58_34350 [Nocardia sp. NPDC004654]|uniref:hypothetical protein n=1 Tax=Nocardia sp. NPDC004654 TaxID=3154776 RepID=UPI0033AE0A8F
MVVDHPERYAPEWAAIKAVPIIREQKRKITELEQAIEILLAATSFFARASDPRQEYSARSSSTPTRAGSWAGNAQSANRPRSWNR